MSEDEENRNKTPELSDEEYKELTGVTPEQAKKLYDEWGITPDGEWNDYMWK